MIQNKETPEQRLKKNSRMIVNVLRNAEEPIGSNKLCELTGLKKSQVAAAIKYQRRWFLEHPNSTQYNYIVSGKKGYRMPKTDEEYVIFYQTLYSWSKSVRATIEAVGRYLEANGYDINQIKFNSGDGSFLTDEIGGEDSWHEEINNPYIEDYNDYLERKGLR